MTLNLKYNCENKVYSKYKILLFLSILFVFILNLNIIHSMEVNSFDLKVNITTPKSATIIENWKFNFDSQEEVVEFKNEILELNTNFSELKKIHEKLEPHIYINEYKDVKIGFNEVEQIVTIEYNTEDVCLIEYLDYDDKIIWKLNENLFRNFVINNLYSIPKGSYINIELYEELFFGETLPKAEIQDDVLVWSGISSNELRLIAIEKKPPKPTFVFLNLYNNESLLNIFGIVIAILLVIILFSLIFKKSISKNINSFVIRNSKIKTKNSIREIVDREYFKK